MLRLVGESGLKTPQLVKYSVACSFELMRGSACWIESAVLLPLICVLLYLSISLIWFSSTVSFGSIVEATLMVISSGFGVVLRFPRQMATAQELLISSFWLYLPLDMYKSVERVTLCT